MPPSPAAAPPDARAVFAFLALAVALRLTLMFATGFCDDEAYVVVISRAPALSYFDHPPLHQWLLAAWTAGFGEGRAARAPFFALTLVTTGALYGLARRLFSAAAARWTAFAFSASAYFLVYPDGYLMPDPPLLAFCALGAWAVAEAHFGPAGRGTIFWLAAGLAFGLAGLSKYAAILAPVGLLGFALARARGWFAEPRAYAGAALALLCMTPVILWNARHGWVSFAFQVGRAAHGLALDGRAVRGVAESLGAQLGSLTPWIALALLAGLARAARRGAGDGERFLLWLAAPPLLAFALMPFVGERPISHWFNSGWLFAFPLGGAWLAERSAGFQRGFFALAAAMAVVVAAGYLAAVRLGPIEVKGLRDPTRAMFDYPAAPLRAAYQAAGADFALIDNWRIGGRVGVALGPSVPVCAMGDDPRGFAFACDARRRLGQTALVVRTKESGADAEPFFQAWDPLSDLVVGRNRAAEWTLSLARGGGLKRAPPLPYGP